MLEADRQVEERQAEPPGDALGDQGVRESARDPARPLLLLDEMQRDQGEDLEGREDSPVLVAGPDPIGVPVGGDADVGAALHDRAAQRREILGTWLGRLAAE